MHNDDKLRGKGEKHVLSKKQMQIYIQCSTDIIYFAENYFKIVSIDEGLITIKLHEYQRRMLKAFVGSDDDERRHVACLSARQIGKCISNDGLVRIRNKNSGVIKTIKIGNFFDEINASI